MSTAASCGFSFPCTRAQLLQHSEAFKRTTVSHGDNSEFDHLRVVSFLISEAAAARPASQLASSVAGVQTSMKLDWWLVLSQTSGPQFSTQSRGATCRQSTSMSANFTALFTLRGIHKLRVQTILFKRGQAHFAVLWAPSALVHWVSAGGGSRWRTARDALSSRPSPCRDKPRVA